MRTYKIRNRYSHSHESESLSHTAKHALRKSTPTAQASGRYKSASLNLIAGKTYLFHLALTNPLYDPIQVRLSVQRMHVAASSDGAVPRFLGCMSPLELDGMHVCPERVQVCFGPVRVGRCERTVVYFLIYVSKHH